MSQGKDDKPEVVEIRRYSNRRFYDTSRSRHVTLEGIRDIVRSGRDVRITEASTGEDITSRILTQIILDYDDRKITAFPAVMLHRLLRSSEGLLLDFIGKSFENATRVFQDSQRSAEEQWQRVAGISQVPQEAARWWQEAMGGAVPPRAKFAAGGASPPGENGSSGDWERVVEELRGQLQSVREELKKMRGSSGSGAAKGVSAKRPSASRKRG